MIKDFINRHLAERFKHHFVGTRRAQSFWERLHELSLRGMNIGNSGTFHDSGELWVIDSLFACANDGGARIIFDVGANVGDYASQVLARHPSARLFCFEPSRATFNLLSSRLAGRENVRLFNFGLGHREESLSLFSDVEGSGMASFYRRRLDHLNIQMNRTEEVLVKTLDGFCAAEGIERIDLLKIDVEGHELKVLHGAQRIIRSNAIKLIQFEFGGTDIDSRTFLQDFFYLLTPHYKICRLLKNGVSSLMSYQERYEVFVYSNFVAVSERLYDSFISGER